MATHMSGGFRVVRAWLARGLLIASMPLLGLVACGGGGGAPDPGAAAKEGRLITSTPALASDATAAAPATTTESLGGTWCVGTTRLAWYEPSGRLVVIAYNAATCGGNAALTETLGGQFCNGTSLISWYQPSGRQELAQEPSAICQNPVVETVGGEFCSGTSLIRWYLPFGRQEVAESPSARCSSQVTSLAEGFWSGSTSSGLSVSLLVGPTGRSFGLYSFGNNLIGGVVGTVAVAGTAWSGSVAEFSFVRGSTARGTWSGAVQSRQNLALQTPGYFVTANYDPLYAQPAANATVAGTFSGRYARGASDSRALSLEWSSSGTLRASLSATCQATGTATPDSRGRNRFDIVLTLVGDGCGNAVGASLEGQAYFQTVGAQLLLAAMNADQSDGILFLGRR